MNRREVKCKMQSILQWMILLYFFCLSLHSLCLDLRELCRNNCNRSQDFLIRTSLFLVIECAASCSLNILHYSYHPFLIFLGSDVARYWWIAMPLFCSPWIRGSTLPYFPLTFLTGLKSPCNRMLSNSRMNRAYWIVFLSQSEFDFFVSFLLCLQMNSSVFSNPSPISLRFFRLWQSLGTVITNSNIVDGTFIVIKWHQQSSELGSESTAVFGPANALICPWLEFHIPCQELPFTRASQRKPSGMQTH